MKIIPILIVFMTMCGIFGALLTYQTNENYRTRIEELENIVSLHKEEECLKK